MIREDFKVHSLAGGVLTRRPVPSPRSEVTATRVHPLVWAEARRRAGGDLSRIEVISATEVRVRN